MAPPEHKTVRTLQPLFDAVDPTVLPTWQGLIERLDVVVSAAATVVRADSTGLMMLNETGVPQVAGVTDHLTWCLAEAQVQTCQGPCLDAGRMAATVAVADLAAEAEYAQLWERLQPTGVRAVLCSPIFQGDRVAGCFNAELCRPHSWAFGQRRANEAYARALGRALRAIATTAEAASPADRYFPAPNVSQHYSIRGERGA